MISEGTAYCIRLSYLAEKTEFDIPDTYKEASLTEMMAILEKMEQ